MVQFCIFNPDHDLALAHGDTHYMSPTSAVKFAADAACLPLWLFDDAMVCVPVAQFPNAFRDTAERCGVPLQVVESLADAACCCRVVPWGWNHNLVWNLRKGGVPDALLPDDQQLMRIRDLSHRRHTRRAMEFLRERLPFADLLPQSAVELTAIEDVEKFVSQHGMVVLKMPWSGSGRGLRLVKGEMTVHQRGWAAQSIRKYGCVMGELYYTVVQDFAMEFELSDTADFCGYSLFTTRHGVYQENVLLSDAMAEERLSAYVEPSLLWAVRQALVDFLSAQVLPFYKGFVGVDMFVYQKDGQYFLHPVVELNLRMTMGVAASRFYRRHVLDGKVGRWRLRFLAGAGELMAEDEVLRARYPLRVERGRVVAGYLSLTPVYADSAYAVQCLLT